MGLSQCIMWLTNLIKAFRKQHCFKLGKTQGYKMFPLPSKYSQGSLTVLWNMFFWPKLTFFFSCNTNIQFVTYEPVYQHKRCLSQSNFEFVTQRNGQILRVSEMGRAAPVWLSTWCKMHFHPRSQSCVCSSALPLMTFSSSWPPPYCSALWESHLSQWRVKSQECQVPQREGRRPSSLVFCSLILNTLHTSYC